METPWSTMLMPEENGYSRRNALITAILAFVAILLLPVLCNGAQLRGVTYYWTVELSLNFITNDFHSVDGSFILVSAVAFLLPLIYLCVRIFRKDNLWELLAAETVVALLGSILMADVERYGHLQGGFVLCALFSLASVVSTFIKDKRMGSAILPTALCIACFICYFYLPAAMVCGYPYLGKDLNDMLSRSYEFELWNALFLGMPFVCATICLLTRDRKGYIVSAILLFVPWLVCLFDSDEMNMGWGMAVYTMCPVMMLFASSWPVLMPDREELLSQGVLQTETADVRHDTACGCGTKAVCGLSPDVWMIILLCMVYAIDQISAGVTGTAVSVLAAIGLMVKLAGKKPLLWTALVAYVICQVGFRVVDMLMSHYIATGNLAALHSFDYVSWWLVAIYWLVPILVFMTTRTVSVKGRVVMLVMPVLGLAKLFWWYWAMTGANDAEETRKIQTVYYPTLGIILCIVFVAFGALSWFVHTRQKNLSE